MNFSDNLSHNNKNMEVWSNKINLWKRERLLFLSNFKLNIYLGLRSSIKFIKKFLSFVLIDKFILDISSWVGLSNFLVKTIKIK